MKNCQSTDLDTEKRTGELAKCEVGSILTFGSYYQSNASEKEPIKWIVLAREENKALLVSKYLLDAKPYNTEWKNVTWETCTLRKWLNNEFLNTAFNETEKGKTVETTIKNQNNPMYGTNGGHDTKDKVFLLNVDEAYKYFKDNDARKCKPTDYAISMGAYTLKNYNDNGWWWLRFPGSVQNFATLVFNTGGVDFGGHNVDNDFYCVRPALWINL